MSAAATRGHCMHKYRDRDRHLSDDQLTLHRHIVEEHCRAVWWLPHWGCYNEEVPGRARCCQYPIRCKRTHLKTSPQGPAFILPCLLKAGNSNSHKAGIFTGLRTVTSAVIDAYRRHDKLWRHRCQYSNWRGMWRHCQSVTNSWGWRSKCEHTEQIP